MPHRQNLRPFGAGEHFTAVERGGRSAVEQAGGVEQGVFKTQVFDHAVNAGGGQVMIEGAVEGGAVFGAIAGWVGDDFFSWCNSY